ncbi:MAG: hypothetical protein ACRDJC_23875 [Thermomicrobiales bacterium]
MPARPISLSSGRDVLLVAVVATVAFALGAVAAEHEDDPGTPRLVPVSYRGGPGDRARAADENPSLSPLRALTLPPPRHTRPAHAPPRVAPALPLAPTPPPSLPRKRFSGDGAMRREIALMRIACSGRVYLLQTASLLHRREWIGLEDRIAEIASGNLDNPVRPAAHSGPR